jgi:hypothetical protein
MRYRPSRAACSTLTYWQITSVETPAHPLGNIKGVRNPASQQQRADVCVSGVEPHVRSVERACRNGVSRVRDGHGLSGAPRIRGYVSQDPGYLGAHDCRRVALGYRNRTDFADSLQFTVRTLSDIENGVRKASPGTYAMLENKLGWAPGSIDTILAGGEPKELVVKLPGVRIAAAIWHMLAGRR